MPGLAANQVTLNEVLEVRGGPLNEDELWAILFECSEKVKNIFLSGRIQHLHKIIHILSTNNLILCSSGKIRFCCEDEDGDILIDKRFLPPEYFTLKSGEITQPVLEKMFCYTIGMIIYAAAEYGASSVGELCLSSDIEALLMYMCEDDPKGRCNLTQVLQACNCRKGIFLSVERVKSLVKSILGSGVRLDDDSPPPTTFSTPSAVVRYSSQASDFIDSFPLPKLQALAPLNSSITASQTSVSKDSSTAKDVKSRDPSRKKPRDSIQVSFDRGDSLENYEPLTKTHQQSLEALPDYNIPDKPLSSNQYSFSQEEETDKLEKLPPVNKVKSLSRDKNRSTYSTPVFKRMLTVEENKLKNDGFLDEERCKIKVVENKYHSSPPEKHDLKIDGSLDDNRGKIKIVDNKCRTSPQEKRRLDYNSLDEERSKIKIVSNKYYSSPPEKKRLRNDTSLDEGRRQFADNRYKSMPTLDSFPSDRNGKGGSVNSAEFPYTPSKRDYRKLTRFASRGSMDSESVATSMMSSTLSLNHGSYLLDFNQRSTLQRPFSFYSGSSNDGSGYNSNNNSHHRHEKSPQGGPEFISIPNDSELAVVDITPTRIGPISRGQRKLFVQLPNAQKLSTLVEVSSLTKDLFDQVTNYLEIKETVYFGLTQIKDGEHLFLDLDSKISKHSPNGWKEGKKNKSEFILHFKVKFFIEDVDLLKHYITRHLFYIQLRREVLCSYMYCHDDAAVYLASLALQAEFGDYVEHHHGKCYFSVEHYLPGRVLGRISRADIFHQLPLMHHSYRGLSIDEAERNFIAETQKLKEYGILFYQVSRSKKDPSDSILLGVCVRGILLFELRGQMKTEIHSQQWHFIEKFSFRRKKFVIHPRKASGFSELALYCTNYKKAKYLLKMCQSFHRFSLISQSRSVAKENQKQGKLSMKVDPKYEKKRKYRKDAETLRGNSPDDVRQNRDPATIKTPLNRSADESKLLESAERVEGRHTNQARFLQRQLSEEEMDHSPMLMRRLSSLPCDSDRKVKVVHLNRRPGQGLGITIVGGEDSSRLGNGIFVKSIHPDGLAAKTGNIQKGDRLLSVNGESLEEVPHEKAAQLLKLASDEVDLIVSQVSPGSSFLDRPGLSLFEESELTGNLEDPDMAEVKEYEQLRMARPVTHDASLNFSPIPKQLSLDAKQKQHIGANQQRKDLEEAEEKVVAVKQAEFEEIPALKFPENYTRMEEKQIGNSDDFQDYDDYDDFEVKDSEEPIDECHLIQLRKRDNSLGIVLTGGIGSSFPHGGIYVQSMEKGGPADEDGRLEIGDRLLEANGINLEYVTLKQALEIVKRIPLETSLIISRSEDIGSEIFKHARPNKVEASPKANHSSQKIFSVVIEKGVGGLGLSLVGGKGSGYEFKDQLMIRRLFPGQPAAASGHLRIGDVILAVNGTSLEGYTQQEAISLLRKHKDIVELSMKRPSPSEIPEELLLETPRETLDPESVLKNIQKKITGQTLLQMPPPHADPYTSSTDNNESEAGADNQNYNESEMNGYNPNDYQNEMDGEQVYGSQEDIGKEAIGDADADIIPYSETLRMGTMEVKMRGNEQQNRPKSDGRRIESLGKVDSIELNENCTPPGKVNANEVHDKFIPPEKVDRNEDIERKYSTESEQSEDSFDDKEVKLDSPITALDKVRAGSLDDTSSISVSSENELSEPMGEFYSRFDSIGLSALKPKTTEEAQKQFREALQERNSKIPSPLEEERVEEVSRPKESSQPLSESLASKVNSERGSDNDSVASQKSQYEYVDTVLKKGPTGLGFTLAGGKSTTGGCYIRDIIADPAKANGSLKSGDQIVRVNSIDLSNSEHMEAVETLRNAGKSVRLRLKRKLSCKKKGKVTSNREVVTIARNSSGKFGLLLKEENGEMIIGDISHEEAVVSNGSLRCGDRLEKINDIPVEGMTLSDANKLLNSSPPTVRLSILHRSQAAKKSKYAVNVAEENSPFKIGAISSGYDTDRSETAARHDTTTAPALHKAVSYVRSDSLQSDCSGASSTRKTSSVMGSPLLKRLNVFQGSGRKTTIRKNPSSDQGEIIQVQLTKGATGLGMSLTSKNDFGIEGGTFVANINPGSVAEKSGSVKKGDRLISVNGINIEDLSQKEIVETLRCLNGQIALEMYRFPSPRCIDDGNGKASQDEKDTCGEGLSDDRPKIDNSMLQVDSKVDKVNKDGNTALDITRDEEKIDENGVDDDARRNEDWWVGVKDDVDEDSLSWADSDVSLGGTLSNVSQEFERDDLKANRLAVQEADGEKEVDATRCVNKLVESLHNQAARKQAVGETSHDNDISNPEGFTTPVEDAEETHQNSVSFSSTFDNLTPSSSIFTSTLDDITLNDTSSTSDFEEFSSTLLPDLSMNATQKTDGNQHIRDISLVDARSTNQDQIGLKSNPDTRNGFSDGMSRNLDIFTVGNHAKMNENRIDKTGKTLHADYQPAKHVKPVFEQHELTLKDSNVNKNGANLVETSFSRSNGNDQQRSKEEELTKSSGKQKSRIPKLNFLQSKKNAGPRSKDGRNSGSGIPLPLRSQSKR